MDAAQLRPGEADLFALEGASLVPAPLAAVSIPQVVLAISVKHSDPTATDKKSPGRQTNSDDFPGWAQLEPKPASDLGREYGIECTSASPMSDLQTRIHQNLDGR